MTLTRESGARTVAVTRLPFTGDPSGRITDPQFSAQLLAAVKEDGLAVIHGFPCDGGALVEFGRSLGELEPADPFKPNPDPDDPMDWLGHTNVARKKTWGNRLALHTAAGHAPREPELHIMLMLDQGFIDPDPDADNGQSRLSRLPDAMAKLRADLEPDRFDEVVRLLETTPVSTEYPFPDEPRTEPILRRTGPGTWRFRYWIKILEFAERNGATAEQLAALRAFDEALNDPQVEFDLPLGDGEMVVLDNLRVAHGRRAFQKERVDENGNVQTTSRRIYNVHVFTEL